MIITLATLTQSATAAKYKEEATACIKLLHTTVSLVKDETPTLGLLIRTILLMEKMETLIRMDLRNLATQINNNAEIINDLRFLSCAETISMFALLILLALTIYKIRNHKLTILLALTQLRGGERGGMVVARHMTITEGKIFDTQQFMESYTDYYEPHQTKSTYHDITDFWRDNITLTGPTGTFYSPKAGFIQARKGTYAETIAPKGSRYWVDHKALERKCLCERRIGRIKKD